MATLINKKEVRRWMLERDVASFRDLAEKAKVSEATIYNALDKEGWHSRTLDAIAEALEVSPLALLVEEEERKWDELFADPRSERVLGDMAAKARAAHRRGETRPLAVDDIQ
jgi:lambda repressor-like predicted transcriptional regulator